MTSLTIDFSAEPCAHCGESSKSTRSRDGNSAQIRGRGKTCAGRSQAQENVSACVCWVLLAERVVCSEAEEVAKIDPVAADIALLRSVLNASHVVTVFAGLRWQSWCRTRRLAKMRWRLCCSFYERRAMACTYLDNLADRSRFMQVTPGRPFRWSVHALACARAATRHLLAGRRPPWTAHAAFPAVPFV